MQLNTSLSSGEAKFALWVEEKMPKLLFLFDFERRILVTSRLENYLAVASSGEQTMARFVASVWRQDNKYEFSILDAAGVLDEDDIETITEWVKHPIWP